MEGSVKQTKYENIEKFEAKVGNQVFIIQEVPGQGIAIIKKNGESLNLTRFGATKFVIN